MIIYLFKLILILVFNTIVNTYYMNSECKCCGGNSKSGGTGSESKCNLGTNQPKSIKPPKGIKPQKVKTPVKAKYKLNNDHKPLLDTNQLYAPFGSKGVETGNKKEEEIKDDKKEVKKDINNQILIEFDKNNNKITIDLKNLELFPENIKKCIVHKQFTDRTTFCKLDEASYNLFTTDSEIELKNTPKENTFVLFAVKTPSGKYYFGYCKNGNTVGSHGLFDGIYTNAEIIILGSGNNLKNIDYMFFGCGNLKKIIFTIKGINNSNVISTNSMFKDCNELAELNLSNFDTSKVTSMICMFSGCSSLKELNLSKFNTSKVTNMAYMFDGCTSLTKLDISIFDTSNVRNMSFMFSNCSSLNKLDLSNWNTDNVTDMENMFYNCNRLTSLDVSSFNTNNVKNMCGMFYCCSSLEELNLSSFNTYSVYTMSYMFYGCDKLKGKVTTNDKNINNKYGQFIKNANK